MVMGDKDKDRDNYRSFSSQVRTAATQQMEQSLRTLESHTVGYRNCRNVHGRHASRCCGI